MSTAIAEDAMRPLFRPVVDAWDETDDTFNIEIEMPARWEFQPGQFNMLYAFGIGEGTAIGWKQITGFTVGLVIAGIGAAARGTCGSASCCHGPG